MTWNLAYLAIGYLATSFLFGAIWAAIGYAHNSSNTNEAGR